MSFLTGNLKSAWARDRSSAVFCDAFVPALLFLVLALCFYQESLSGYARLIAPAAGICWHALLYYQAPTYRQLMAMDPAVFSYSSALVSFVFFETCTWVSLQSPILAVLEDNNDLLSRLSFMYAMTLFVMATIVIMRHFQRYYPQEPSHSDADLAPVERGDREPGLERRCADLADSYGLTERETEVLVLLARGYSRPYIQKRLFISEGTIKTHTRNIYRKFQVTNKDELIELVRADIRA